MLPFAVTIESICEDTFWEVNSIEIDKRVNFHVSGNLHISDIDVTYFSLQRVSIACLAEVLGLIVDQYGTTRNGAAGYAGTIAMFRTLGLRRQPCIMF